MNGCDSNIPALAIENHGSSLNMFIRTRVAIPYPMHRPNNQTLTKPLLITSKLPGIVTHLVHAACAGNPAQLLS